MSQTAIPYLFMCGGSSRGPYFRRADLPEDQGKLAEVLIAAVGSGHPLNIDGIGGGVVCEDNTAIDAFRGRRRRSSSTSRTSLAPPRAVRD